MQPHDNTEPTKTCTKCGETKPLSAFSKHRGRSDGLNSICKKCGRDIARQYRQDNLERLREYDRNRRNSPEEKAAKAEYDRQRRAELGEQLLHQHRRKWKANKEKYNARQRQYYRENKKRTKQRVKDWVRDNPEKAKAQSERRRARELNAPGDFTGEDIERQYAAQKGRCFWCGCKVGDTYHVDHVIPLSRGGSNDPDNLVIACPSCNCSKQDKLPHEWPEGGRLL